MDKHYQHQFGQAENNFTPLQMARYIAILANGGKRIDISVVDKVLDKDGKEVSKKELTKYINKRLGLKEIKEEDLKIKKKNLDIILSLGCKALSVGRAYTGLSITASLTL